jgi:prophage regulatory protein
MQPTKSYSEEKLLRLPQVIAIVNLSRSSIYSAIQKGTFPAPVKLSRRAVGFPASRVHAWVSERICAGDAS